MAKKVELKVDSGILQYAPKGAYYEDADEQFKQVFQMWKNLFSYDRTLFCLTMLLGGTGFSKGAMSHMLLGNPIENKGNLPVPEGLSFDYESKVILYNLHKESVPRALKNLLMFSGNEGFTQINNARTRKIILEFIFGRSNKELESLAINFKGKLKVLLRHALGKQDVFKILFGDQKTFQKWIGRYNRNALPVFYHIFDKEVPATDGARAYFPQIEKYWKLRDAAKRCDVQTFKSIMKDMPQRTVIGFRNTYKVPIELSEIYEKAKVSDKEAIQLESAAKKSGAKTFKVNYEKQDIYDLFKAFYFKLMNGEHDNMDEIEAAIVKNSEKVNQIDIGECVVVIDASASMLGSDKRPLHPFLTSLCIISVLKNIKNVFYVGGNVVKAPTKSGVNVLIPGNGTNLSKGLIDAMETGVKNIVIISDGYENEVKGMFEHTYNHFKNAGRDFNLIHLNPVFASDAKSGTARKLVKDISPMPLADYKYIETEIIFQQMLENRDTVKRMLLNKYKALIK